MRHLLYIILIVFIFISCSDDNDNLILTDKDISGQWEAHLYASDNRKITDTLIFTFDNQVYNSKAGKGNYRIENDKIIAQTADDTEVFLIKEISQFSATLLYSKKGKQALLMKMRKHIPVYSTINN